MERREWFQMLAALAAAPAGASMQQGGSTPPAIDKATLAAALKVLGLEFSEPQIEMMLANVNRARGNFDALRKIELPLETSPAFTFRPNTPPAAKNAKPRFQPSRTKVRTDWKNIEDLSFWPVTSLGALLKARKITSTALTRMYLERLKQFSPKLNCTITLTEDLALDQARRADTELRRGRYRGPLHGIPWGAKDLLATKGIPTTYGAEPFQNQVLDYDATVVERLEKAGAVLVAKLSMGALAMGGLWFRGMTRTPWDTERTSSGSSAGSASATAAGLVAFSIGTETLGSIISPSIRCGTTGLRPTYGRVSRHGAMALSWTLDKIGPICRTVEDCALVLHAIYGPDGRDPSTLDAPFDWTPRLGLKGLRIGLVQKDFDSLKDEEKKIYNQALADLRRAGAATQPVELPSLDLSVIRTILSAEGAAAFDDLTRNGGVDQLKDQSAGAWPNSFRSSRLIPAVEYIRACRARTLQMKQMDSFFNDWDVLVGHPYAGPLMSIANLTGHPQIVVPCGFHNKLPYGLVFTGKLCREGDPMRVAMAYQQATQWHLQHPPLS
ncbi:MAG: amidase [Bryobacterales bacterium]|nr:amidase [Bryobacterales bacterium]